MINLLSRYVALLGVAFLPFNVMAGDAIIIDHTCSKVQNIPASALKKARETLHIAYGHTSHGSQITTGMDKLGEWAASSNLSTASLLTWKNGAGDFDLRDTPFDGAEDLGNPDRSAWAEATRKYLKANPDINVIMWSWCGQSGWASPEEIDLYLNLMSGLEKEFPKVRFVYMTGHLDGSGEKGKHFQNSEKIRSFCKKNGKILFDFADIESYDPDGKTNYNKLNGDDGCSYDPKGGEDRSRNWATDWQEKNPGKWYNCDAAHTQPLNANMKAFAAWHLFARLAGWSGK